MGARNCTNKPEQATASAGSCLQTTGGSTPASMGATFGTCSGTGTDANTKTRYRDAAEVPLVVSSGELRTWALYRAVIAEFVATLLFIYVTVATIIGNRRQAETEAAGAGILGIAWSFGGMIFVLVYCTAGLSDGHVNPAVTFAMLLARRVSLVSPTID